jgi:hypothetical protein
MFRAAISRKKRAKSAALDEKAESAVAGPELGRRNVDARGAHSVPVGVTPSILPLFPEPLRLRNPKRLLHQAFRGDDVVLIVAIRTRSLVEL